MPLVAKRNVAETWREAVAKRSAAFGVEAACLAFFDEALRRDLPEHEAAFLALQEWNCLFEVDLPGAPGVDSLSAEIGQIEPEGS